MRVSRTCFKVRSSLKLAVVGSGPAGFYTAYRVMEKLPGSTIDMYEALPVPFGLSRFGVAPDHPEVKNCQEKFVEVANSPNFRFIGNVNIGTNLPLKALYDNYNSVIFAYGSTEDRLLNVAGETHPGVISARELVGWYNGLPQFASLAPPLEDAEDVVVVGNGNVALDVARILLCDVERLKATDICEHAYDILRKSKVKNVRIVGRRGVLQSAFTTKEIRELINEPGTQMRRINEEHIEHYRPFIPVLDRPLKRMMQVLEKASKEQSKEVPRHFSLDYLLSPTRFYASSSNEKLLASTAFEINSLVQEDLKSPAVAQGTGETTSFKSELAFRSIGYKSIPLPGSQELGIPFDQRRGHIPNQLGRIVGDHGHPLPGLYVTGWVKNGPTGVIAKTMWDSFEVAETLLEDYYGQKLDVGAKFGFAGVEKDINCRVVSWNDWLKLDDEEMRRGQAVGKSRCKFTNVEEMLDFLA
jgi:adrenodoxin-NADP+ reductase